MSFLVKAIENLAVLPPIITRGLQDLKEKDKISHCQLVQLEKDEKDFLERLRQTSKSDPEFDENPYKMEASILARRRQELTLLQDNQIKHMQALYDLFVQKIAFFDSCSKDVSHLFPTVGADFVERNDDFNPRRKKRKISKSFEFNSPEPIPVVDNPDDTIHLEPEPLYCFCRQNIVDGLMIGCDNKDCLIGWYHCECVGISEDQKEKLPPLWFCSTCNNDGYKVVV